MPAPQHRIFPTMARSAATAGRIDTVNCAMILGTVVITIMPSVAGVTRHPKPPEDPCMRKWGKRYQNASDGTLDDTIHRAAAMVFA